MWPRRTRNTGETMARNESRGVDGRLEGDLLLRISALLVPDLLRLRTRALRSDIVARFGCCGQTANRAVALARKINGIERRMVHGR